MKMMVSCMCIILYCCFLYSAIQWDIFNYKTQKINEEEVIELSQYIKDKDSLLCYDIPARIYVILDILPHYRYFTNQNWHSNFDVEIYNKTSQYLNEGKVKYVITYKEVNPLEILNKYEIIYENETFSLYELKNLK